MVDDHNKKRKGPRFASGVRMVISYDGTDFCGWQSQPRQRTVQGVLHEHIKRLCGDEDGTRCSALRGASRTDSGVHALRQVISFGHNTTIPPRGFMEHLNGALPRDVSIRAVTACKARYDPRFDSTGKRYRYLLQVGTSRNPLWHRQAWYLKPGFTRRGPKRHLRPAEAAAWLDLDAMQRAANALLGEHDFHAFRSADDERENTIREMRSIDIVPGVLEDPSLVAIVVEGNAFMKNMVRIMAGTLVDVGRDRMTPEAAAALLEPSARRAQGGQTAPPQGLTLMEVFLGRPGYPHSGEP